MTIAELFIGVNKPDLNNDWTKNINESLSILTGIEQVMILEENEHTHARISIIYDFQRLDIQQIEQRIKDSGAYITDMNIHFPSHITGISNFYSAGAVSILLNKSLKEIEGVLGSAISSNGKVKVTIDTSNNNKEEAIQKILNVLSRLTK